MECISKVPRALRWLVSVLLLFAAMPVSSAADDTAALLDTLDNVLRNSRRYVDARRAVISKLKASLASAADDEERYRLTGRLREEYRSFDIDSALYYANEKMAVARRIGNGSYINDARMNIAEMNGVYGMYKEALDYIDRVDKSVLDVYQMEYYYHVYRNIYGLMADNSSNADMRKLYLDRTDKYRDSILLVNTPGSFNYIIVKADKDNVHGRYDEAVKALKEASSKCDNIHDNALIDYTLAMSYLGMGDMENFKRHLILSAINDIKSGIREYTSLRMLATQLYNDGDVDRAYAYMTRCMDDAVACNSLWRIYEVQKSFPIINKAYHQKLARQRKIILCSFAFIILLTLFLAVAVVVIKKQKDKVSAARRLAQEANVRLKELNRELSESSHIKEEYIDGQIPQTPAEGGAERRREGAFRRNTFKVVHRQRAEGFLRPLRRFVPKSVSELRRRLQQPACARAADTAEAGREAQHRAAHLRLGAPRYQQQYEDSELPALFCHYHLQLQGEAA